ncbi:MAG: 16S rRNA (uracil(1498)-N(3))-methyltransferase [Treponema sp.]|jgi:16S rRNA (uracil1498-N3)-methyltransferase|nr:16S rRNA (uracil(1498)-N(3))-methyltransferase [Treponema sp.]
MKRFILNKAPDRNGLVRLEGADYHYLVRVRRLAVGEYFPAVLPSGAETLIRVRSIEGGVLTGDISPGDFTQGGLSAADTEAGAPSFAPVCGIHSETVPIILFQALPKGEKMDIIVRQAAEGALTGIVPFISEFSIPKIKGNKKNGDGRYTTGDSGANRLSRWERIIKEARQQSGSPVATAIRPPVEIDGLFAYWEELKQNRPKIAGLLFHHLPLARASLHGYLDSNPEMVALAIGPEGGFSSAEVSRFLAAGFKALTIGNTILRTETAALYAAAAVRIISLERNSWEIKINQTGNG